MPGGCVRLDIRVPRGAKVTVVFNTGTDAHECVFGKANEGINPIVVLSKKPGRWEARKEGRQGVYPLPRGRTWSTTGQYHSRGEEERPRWAGADLGRELPLNVLCTCVCDKLTDEPGSIRVKKGR